MEQDEGYAQNRREEGEAMVADDDGATASESDDDELDADDDAFHDEQPLEPHEFGSNLAHLYLDPDPEDATDTTAEQARAGRDIQGIPWGTTAWTREAYRERRDAEYKSYFNREAEVRASKDRFDKVATRVRSVPSSDRHWEFHRNWRRVQSSVVHFQLRHLLAATSAHDIFYCSENRVMHCNLLGKAASQEVLDASGAVPIPGIGSFPVCTLCAKEGLVAAGGFNGELVVRRIGSMRKFDAALRVTNSENGITNAIDAYRPRCGAQLQLVLSNNDCAVRLYDAGSFLSVATFRLPWAVNCSAADPHGRLLCVVGDDPENVILDACSGAVVARLRGHVDYSFACAWHPDGNVIATGNQDLTTRVYDLRYTKKPMALLKSRIGAVRSLRFSPDGRFLAAAEPADYVRLYDAAMTYTTAEEIDLFGELAGICFDPVVGNRLFIAVSDMHYASLLQYNRRDSLDLVE